MSVLTKLRDSLRKKQLMIVDPVFGEIVYSPRLGEWSVDLYICIGWEEEHNRAAFLEDGKLIDFDVV